MNQSLTPKAELIDLRLREKGRPGLLDLVAERRSTEPATPWRVIAGEIEELTDLRVTDMGVRYWVDKAEAGAAA